MVWVKKEWTKRPWDGQWGQSQGKWSSSSSSSGPPSVSDDFPIDKDKRYTGTVMNYFKFQGYGFIKPADPELVPGGQLYVGWNNIQTEDRFPFLMKDMEVEFGLMKWKDHANDGATKLRAKTVTLPGGGTIAVQAQEDSKRDFMGGQLARFSGSLKFYNPSRNFGYVALDENLCQDRELDLPRDVCVEEDEVNCGGKRPKWMDNLDVEFGLFKNSEGKIMAHNMTLPGGKPITVGTLVNREEFGDTVYYGKISFLHWRDSWGLIALEALSTAPAAVREKVQQVANDKKQEPSLYFAGTDVANGTWPKMGMRVAFRLYMDSKGPGAMDVAEADEGAMGPSATASTEPAD